MLASYFANERRIREMINSFPHSSIVVVGAAYAK
jgi:hypothetical protein